MDKNIYAPDLAVIKKVRNEAKGIKTFTTEFEDKQVRDSFSNRPGQFVELTVFGVGEAPISITSSPAVHKGYLELSVAAVGKVTSALHLKKEDEVVGLRGPYGNGFPFDEVKGKDILFVGGGIGLAPLRSLINQMFAQRSNFGRTNVLYGAREPGLLCFMDDLRKWDEVENSEVLLTVDAPDDGWQDNVGVVGALLPKARIDVENTVAFVCGPPIMIHFVILDLFKMGFKEDKIITTMERRMECGFGKCGHCNIGEKYVCLDGPVFSYKQLRELGETI